MGRALAGALDQNEYDIIGTSREPDTVENKLPGIRYEQLNLNDDKSIKDLIKKAGWVDILINNAGYSQIGPCEDIPFDRIEALFDTNFFGAVKLIQGFLPKMREKRKGFIINISSLSGRVSIPFNSIYSASKHALEGFTKALRNEAAPFGIKVTVISPSHMKTSILMERQIVNGSEYSGMMASVKQNRDKKISGAPEPELLVGKILKILKKKKPQPLYTIGRYSDFLALIIKIFPAGIVEKVLVKISIDD